MIGSICLACQEKEQRFSRKEWLEELRIAEENYLHEQRYGPTLDEDELFHARTRGGNAAISIIFKEKESVKNPYTENDPRHPLWQEEFEATLADKDWYLERNKEHELRNQSVSIG